MSKTKTTSITQSISICPIWSESPKLSLDSIVKSKMRTHTYMIVAAAASQGLLRSLAPPDPAKVY